MLSLKPLLVLFGLWLSFSVFVGDCQPVIYVDPSGTLKSFFFFNNTTLHNATLQSFSQRNTTTQQQRKKFSQNISLLSMLAKQRQTLLSRAFYAQQHNTYKRFFNK